MTTQQIKEIIGEISASFVENHMVVGLGTGSTAACFIRSLAKRCQMGLSIQAIASSIESEELAKSLGIPLVTFESINHIDLTFDGADEIDSQKRLIKGAGGALLREKILAYASDEMIVMADESKLVDNLGRSKLPVEVTPFAHHLTSMHLQSLGCTVNLRKKPDGSIFVTDNHNYIYDLHFLSGLNDPTSLERTIKSIPGIIETGLFIDLSGRLIIGYVNGKVEILD